MTHGKYAPAEVSPLVKYQEGQLASGAFCHISVAGIFLYLDGKTRPDVAYAINCCSIYMFCTKSSCDITLKISGLYWKNTKYRGLVLNPNYNMWELDAYPGATFELILDMKILMILHVWRVILVLLLLLRIVQTLGCLSDILRLLFWLWSLKLLRWITVADSCFPSSKSQFQILKQLVCLSVTIW